MGCTVHYLNEKIDAGPILLQDTVEVRPEDSLSRLGIRTYTRGAQLMCEALNRIKRGVSMDFVDAAAVSSYYSWPSREDVKQFKKRGRRFLRLADLRWFLFNYTNHS